MPTKKHPKKDRKRASIEVIHAILPIDGATNIEVIHFDDCSCVVRKGTYKTNQLVLVIRSGVIMPRFLAKQVGAMRKLTKLMVGHIVLKGVLSDAMIFELSLLPEYHILRTKPEEYIGIEVGDLLALTKAPTWKKYIRREPGIMTSILNWFKKTKISY